MKKKLNQIINTALFDLLQEESEKPEETKEKTEKEKKKSASKASASSSPEILTRGAFGSGGRARAFIVDAKARAESEPEELLRDLGVKSAAGGSDLMQVVSILNSAIHSHPAMSKAYAGASIRKGSVSGDSQEREVVAISLGDLDRKNGVRFLAHTLTAALSIGFLNIQSSVQFAIGQNYPIIIYST